MEDLCYVVGVNTRKIVSRLGILSEGIMNPNAVSVFHANDIRQKQRQRETIWQCSIRSSDSSTPICVTRSMLERQKLCSTCFTNTACKAAGSPAFIPTIGSKRKHLLQNGFEDVGAVESFGLGLFSTCHSTRSRFSRVRPRLSYLPIHAALSQVCPGFFSTIWAFASQPT